MFINIGHKSFVAGGRIISVTSPDSAPVKRLIKEARDKGALVDATYGRLTRTVLVMDSGHVVVSSTQPETVASRLNIKPGDAK